MPRILSRLIMSLVVVVGLIGAAELAARANPPPALASAASGKHMSMEGSPFLLWELVPGQHIDLGSAYTINTMGMRDKERGAKTRPRAMAVGDSSVFGWGVSDEEVFTALLEKALPADFINAAVPGYSTSQVYNLLRMRALSLDPDLLIVATLWSDNNYDAFVDSEVITTYASWEESSSARARRSLERFMLFRWLDWELRVSKMPEAGQTRKVGWMEAPDAIQPGQRRRVPVEQYAKNLDVLCALMHERGGGVLFVVLPNRNDLTGAIPKPSWEIYRQVMRDTAQRHNAPIVSIPDAFRASGFSVNDLFVDQMHPSATGHWILGDAIARQLNALGWPASPIQVGAPTSPPPTYTDPFAVFQAPPGP